MGSGAEISAKSVNRRAGGRWSVGRLVRRVLLALAGLVLLWAGAVLILGLAYTVVTPVSTLMLGRWLTGEEVTRNAVPLEAVSPEVPLAVLASEDQRFCAHSGVDWEALRLVIEEAEDGGPSRGASTITMQTAKNLFLWPSRSYLRKGLELPLALYLDLVMSKRRQMEVYLNIAEWGPGVFGIEAAAQRSFNKSAKALTRREAALLASALPNPLRRNPGRPSGGHQRLAGRLAAKAQVAGPLTACLKRG